MLNIAIIGSGISGVTAAYYLKNKHKVTIFEKARGIGGRMSTKRHDDFSFDHGACLFQIKTDEFQSFVNNQINKSNISLWNGNFVNITKNGLEITKRQILQEKFYCSSPRMNSLCKYLSSNININLNTKITNIEKNKTWTLIDENNVKYENFDWVISSIPQPQALEIIPENFKFYSNILSFSMKGIFALMLGSDDKIDLGFDVGFIKGSFINSVYNNSNKPFRANSSSSIVLHANDSFVNNYQNSQKDNIINNILLELSDIIKIDFNKINLKLLHYWKYAISNKHNDNIFYLDNSLKFGLCGDWCSIPNIEGAYISGKKIAENILNP